MNLSYFISKRIRRGQEGGFSSIIHKIAIVSIAVGLAAAILSFLVMKGFQDTIKNKIYSFSGHILVTKYTLNNSMEEQPFSFNIDLVKNFEKYGFIDHVQEYAHKAGLIKTENEVLGVVFKGVGKSFDQGRFQENLVEGRFVHFPDSGYSKEVVLSKTIANKLRLKIGDDLVIHFFQNPPRFRKLNVVGLYETNLSDYFDSKVVMGDIGMVQRLNNWSDSTAGGLELFVDYKKFNSSELRSAYYQDQMEMIWSSDSSTRSKVGQTILLIGSFDYQSEAYEQANTIVNESMDYDLLTEKISTKYVQVFEWLGLIGRQVFILLGIILTVVCVNMVSVVLILVMERTQMIGIFKAMGAKDRLIRSIFFYNGIDLIIKGLLLGNLFGLGLCYLQYSLHFISLNAHDYYMSYVPISWDWLMVIKLNVLVFVLVAQVLIWPTRIISRISPMKAIRFD